MLAAAIFDMDGLLIDSEPLWQRAEAAVFGELGLALDAESVAATTGLRIDEVTRYWLARHPELEEDPAPLAARIVDLVVAAVRAEGVAKNGAVGAVRAARRAGLRAALATSSPRPLIAATLERLGLDGAFEVVHSGADETHGKPHPAVFLTTARRLGLPPAACIVFEDSLPGVTAAKAAGMRCIAVPEAPRGARDAGFDAADLVIDSLASVDERFFAALRVPT